MTGPILFGLALYAGFVWLMTLLFPKGTVTEFRASDCSHMTRRPYEPESSFGDESDYRSRCARCGSVLRWEPNSL